MCRVVVFFGVGYELVYKLRSWERFGTASLCGWMCCDTSWKGVVKSILKISFLEAYSYKLL